MPFDGCRGRLGALLDAAAPHAILARVGRGESASRRGGPRIILTGLLGCERCWDQLLQREDGTKLASLPAPLVCAKTCFKRYVPKRLLGKLDPATGRDGKW